MAAGLIGALAPDLDAIARLWDPMSAITVHRTATHSILGGGIVALAVAGLMWAFRHESFLLLFGGAYLGVLSHTALDLLTPFGTAVLWPLTHQRFSLAQHYIIDPLLSILVLVFLIASFGLKERRISIARIGLTGIALYVLLTGVHGRLAFSRWHEFSESQGIKAIRVAVIPLFPGPFRWLGVAETEDAFYQQPFWLYGSTLEPPRLFSKTNGNFNQLEGLREVRSFLNFARFPWRREFRERSYRVIEYRDLAFADHPLGVLGGPLSLRIWIDDANSVSKVEFGHRF
jgi:membrane-bound metal-dependent hydrolase YbcI (DUF457 family)